MVPIATKMVSVTRMEEPLLRSPSAGGAGRGGLDAAMMTEVKTCAIEKMLLLSLYLLLQFPTR